MLFENGSVSQWQSFLETILESHLVQAVSSYSLYLFERLHNQHLRLATVVEK